MSVECPNGHGRQCIVKNITANLDIPRTSNDVIAVKLQCGCTVGGEKYKAFASQVQTISEKEAVEIQKIKKAYALKKAAAFAQYITKEEVEDVTE